tara:strand:- start:374 stop:517 length:144 start_codon:yes stop_codon:yes gene_type:complete
MNGIRLEDEAKPKVNSPAGILTISRCFFFSHPNKVKIISIIERNLIN